MPRKFDQAAKDRVVRLVEDRILAEGLSTQAACQVVAPKLGGRGTLPGSACSKHASGDCRSVLRKMSLPKMPG